MLISRKTTVDPETGWEEVWEREWGEGDWMLISTSPPRPKGGKRPAPIVKPPYCPPRTGSSDLLFWAALVLFAVFAAFALFSCLEGK